MSVDRSGGGDDYSSMNLITFHRILIGCAIAFCAGYGAWEATAFVRTGQTARLLFALGAFAAAIALFFYLRRLRRFLGLPD